ncbi:hypothetical protein Q7M04_04395 [Candidatus Liberibacter asiaticus]|uniref:hypothetical protein n=1 Tax=Liberibacter asiaticus TaxID=34021 RepID=UPI0004E03651|nr:hypothetical protein [Candidatus Liberibacter asiaticus]BAP26765.1 hypothetical protein CGUJ_04485 [Candidatus Liberibacter asiaticus str. Ishi-1]KAE9509816.1 hypothetical protein FXW22_04365 [Candidatus Liberibacter asiaticus]KAE9511378.1 hypothetical protein FXW31_01770 [Candidatus Liberibacter asiaticus]KAE9511948.1 hypothetical protein FXW32_04340 [Candidatus Liberibacter asiaticus]KAE9513029.1 hypothetical protein FXW35_04270 [Candidatus Liberibacter asiaticus]
MERYGAVRRILPEDKWYIFYSGCGKNPVWDSMKGCLNFSSYDDNSGNIDTDESDINTAIAIRKDVARVLQVSYPLPAPQEITPRMGNRKTVELLIEIDDQKVWLLNVHLKSSCVVKKIQ